MRELILKVVGIGNDFQLQLAITELLKNPGDTRGIEYFAGIVCTSSRTLSRLFIKELGLSFSNWHKQLRLLTAVEMLKKGMLIFHIAFELGYNGPLAFIEMFRKEFGIPPGKYSSNLESFT